MNAAPALRPARKHFIERTAYRKGYRVSEDGKTVTSPYRDEPCNPSMRDDGYPWFSVRTDSGISRRCTVHRLQAYQKFGERIYEAGIVVRHMDGNRENPAAANIEIGTSRDNQMDRPADELRRYALNASKAHQKYDPSAVRAFFAVCRSYKLTQAQFGISSKGTLHYILNGRPSPLSNFGAGGAR